MMGSIYVRSLPKMPPFRASQGAYLRPFDDMFSLWTQINTSPPGGYALAAFTTELTAFKAAYTAANNATQNATIARQAHDVQMPPLRVRLQQYRKAVVGKLPRGSPLLNTILAYSPASRQHPRPRFREWRVEPRLDSGRADIDGFQWGQFRPLRHPHRARTRL